MQKVHKDAQKSANMCQNYKKGSAGGVGGGGGVFVCVCVCVFGGEGGYVFVKDSVGLATFV